MLPKNRKKMKKLTFASLLVLATCMTACSSDDDPVNNPDATDEKYN